MASISLKHRKNASLIAKRKAEASARYKLWRKTAEGKAKRNVSRLKWLQSRAGKAYLVRVNERRRARRRIAIYDAMGLDLSVTPALKPASPRKTRHG